MAIPNATNKNDECLWPMCNCLTQAVCKLDQPIAPTKPQREGDQPMPVRNGHPAVWPIVMQDMKDRHELGIKRYGTPLQPHNGRDMMRDAYEEVLDLAVYLRGAIYERDGK